MKIIFQHDERDCGAACLSMIAEHFGLKLPISRCRELTKTDKSGTNLYGLVDGASQLGLDAKGLQGSEQELKEGMANQEIQLPFIAHIVSEDAMLHFVVVFGEKNGKFHICDPAKGKLWMPVEDFFQIWTGYIVTFQKTAAFQGGNYRKGGFIKFFSLLQGQYAKLAGVLVISLVIASIGILGAFVFEVVIDNFALETGYYGDVEIVEEDDGHDHDDDHDHETGPQGIVDELVELVSDTGFYVIFLSLIALYILQAVIQYLRGYLIADVSRKLDIRLSLAYYNHITDLPVSSISVRQTGEYLARFSDTATIRQAISGAILTLLLDTVMVIACGLFLFHENSKLFCISLGMVLLYAVIVFLYRKPVEKSTRSVMEKNARLQAYFKESIDGIETVKAACANEQVKDKTTKRFEQFVNGVFQNSLLALSQDTLADTVELIGTVLILWAGFSLVLTKQITIGSLITFYVLLSYFTTPVKNLIELQPTIQMALVAADRLNDVLNLKKEENSGSSPLAPVQHWAFQGVDFRYGNRELLLCNVDLSINRGEKIAIVGESGSGKTTLAKLLLRFYEPECGRIEADGVDISKLDLNGLRQSIAYVDQNIFLFSDTIKNNLKLGNPDVSDEEIIEACRVSHADEFINNLPLGYDTPLDENGMNLAGGQRQRLAIARALLKRPQLLILDEATSNLDTITESGIKESIFSIKRDLTCVIIAHRLTTIQQCDRIYVMERGQIVECGNHDELMQKNGKYAALWENSK